MFKVVVDISIFIFSKGSKGFIYIFSKGYFQLGWCDKLIIDGNIDCKSLGRSINIPFNHKQ